ncbi:hypothetical protein CMUS01_06162 [Colletotrichum musicola]|uniref:Uncharacterized protein n=1 Tax=Colletotrichum musicola TaxID=2175873 RepID=A0A8H6NJ11_9PEZI|nr:hypothetical protein CMUS01_06162 [Colletotrichum musicola]
MKFNVVILAGLAAVTSPVTAVIEECVPENDCCISTRGACTRQAFTFIKNYLACPRIKPCPDYGVSWDACKADCCSISKKAGRGCPGKLSRHINTITFGLHGFWNDIRVCHEKPDAAVHLSPDAVRCVSWS